MEMEKDVSCTAANCYCRFQPHVFDPETYLSLLRQTAITATDSAPAQAQYVRPRHCVDRPYKLP